MGMPENDFSDLYSKWNTSFESDTSDDSRRKVSTAILTDIVHLWSRDTINLTDKLLGKYLFEFTKDL